MKKFIDQIIPEQNSVQRYASRYSPLTQRLMSGTCLGSDPAFLGKKSVLSQLIGCVLPAIFIWPLVFGAGLISSTAPALADEQCGAPLGGIVTCDTPALDNYADGINYNTADDLIVNVKDGVTVTRDPGGEKLHAISIYGSNGSSLEVNLEHGSGINATGYQASGLYVRGDGAITVTSGADITVASPTNGNPLASTSGILAQNGDENNWEGSGDITIVQKADSTISAVGPGGGGIYGLNYGTGSVIITSSGEIYTEGELGYGINATNDSSAGKNATVTLEAGGKVTTDGSEAVGLYALNYGTGDALVYVNGQVTTSNDGADGALADIDNDDMEGTAKVILSNTAIINTAGDFAKGAWSYNAGLGEATVISDAIVNTTGESSFGLHTRIINTDNDAASSIMFDANGKVTTEGTLAHGIFAEHRGLGAANVEILSGSRVTTTGNQANGVYGKGRGDVSVVQATDSIVETSGTESIGVSVDGGRDVSADLKGTVTSTGEYGVGVAGFSTDGPAKITIGAYTVVTGGWQKNAGGQGANTGLASAGVLIGSGNASLLTNSGIITAGSDRAVADLDRWDGAQGDLTINNSGTIIGYVELAANDLNNFNNKAGGLFDVRHFADTNGDGVDDTKRVSISDFGSGTFSNELGATVRLAPVQTDIEVDESGYYVPTTGVDSLPLEASFYDINRSGIVQGQFTNLGNFSNAGTIDLRGSKTGNTLVMTGNSEAGGAAGDGVFVSDGGQLLLNTVLNAGVAAGGESGSYSDVLIVDSTEMGSGATRITIDRREGNGAQTPGNGILLVEVRDKEASEGGVFALNGDFVRNGEQTIIGGAYTYNLYHNGVDGDVTDGNWYLRNVGLSPTIPVYEEYPKILVPLIDVPTLQQRVGNRYWNEPAAPVAQTVFCKDAAQNYRCAVTGDQASYYLDNSGATVIQGSGIWARIEGQHGRFEPSISTSGARYETNMWKVQAGLDGLFSESESGKLIGGITAHYGHVNADITASGSDGDVGADGYGVGATLTWYGTNGFYADAQAQATWLKSDINSSTTGHQSIDGNKGFGYALSLEAGQRYAMNQYWTLTPQAQLIYSNVNFDDFTDTYGSTVSLSQGDSLRGRIGLAAEYQESWKTDNDTDTGTGTVSRFSGYGIANLYNEFLKGTRVNVSGVELSSRDDRLWGGLGAGGSYNWNDDKYSVYGEASVNTGLKNFGDSYTVSGTIGLRVKW